ncbi:unnamed protein product [Cylindrotheca closterium]|uniref:Helicase-associated domain-containing protein n=1 Tax=Cylindrotheca closterium TaxID=2856 RepID=A0AAD2G3E5_9STRA|nr:unnamed protein product [Cylindrotheca closterium]CAJ1968130.1 unnamed protein product [Cylindrotheca closterium]
MEDAVDPIVEQVLQEQPPVDAAAAAMETEAPAADGAVETPAPEAAVEAAVEAAAEGKEDDSSKPAVPVPAAAAAAKEGETPKKPKRKEIRKRVRRVGKSEPRKFAKTDGGSSNPSGEGTLESLTGAAARADGATTMPTRRVLSKHDEKWNNMFDKLVEYKKANNHTLVPQCYHDDPRLGRWVHYQRVEYWIFQQSGTGKITPERIGRLESIGFEWDPQKAQWNILFDRLVKFKEEVGHCKVPKGYAKDTELANWVRNQRLEQANSKKGKKSRMTPERYEKLTSLGFRWSTSIAKKGTARKPSPAATAEHAAAVAAAANELTTAAPKEDPTEKAVEAAVAVAIELDNPAPSNNGSEIKDEDDHTVIQI